MPTLWVNNCPELRCPKPLPGREISGMPPDVRDLYEEARRSLAAGAPTATVMACRKILMNTAVAEGAKEGLRFVEYIDYLMANRFLPVKSTLWINSIKDVGNRANHQIAKVDEKLAESTLKNTGALLLFCYEMADK